MRDRLEPVCRRRRLDPLALCHRLGSGFTRSIDGACWRTVAGGGRHTRVQKLPEIRISQRRRCADPCALPLGFLFGLGFGTATEIALLGISASEAAKGISVWSILVFPALFTAGMSLVDTTDGVLMLRAYGWAFVKPIRKLFYNMTITAVSVLVALIVGGLEALGLIADKLSLQGGFWDVIGALNDNFGTLGYLIIAIFAASWIISAIVYR